MPFDDRDGARGATEQDRLSQRAMHGRVESGDRFGVIHQIKAPPPNWKNDRKNELAAKAMLSPKTI